MLNEMTKERKDKIFRLHVSLCKKIWENNGTADTAELCNILISQELTPFELAWAAIRVGELCGKPESLKRLGTITDERLNALLAKKMKEA